MISKAEKMSLLDCLWWCSVRQLPEDWDSKNVYIKAIAKVMRADGSISYVAVKKDKNGDDKIIKSFGNISMIKKILAVYPYLYLDAVYMPTFKGNSKTEKVSYLSALNKNVDYSKKSVKELDKAIISVAIQKQLKAE